MIVLETPRLLLRPISVDDAPAFFALNTDPEVYRYTGEPPPESLAEVERRILEYPDYADYGFGRLGCELKSSGEMIGFCGLKKLPELDGEVDIGFRLARAHWGRGLATEASRTVLRFGFDILGLERIIALVEPENVRSIRVITKLGMTYADDVEYFGEVARRYVRLRSSSGTALGSSPSSA